MTVYQCRNIETKQHLCCVDAETRLLAMIEAGRYLGIHPELIEASDMSPQVPEGFEDNDPDGQG